MKCSQKKNLYQNEIFYFKGNDTLGYRLVLEIAPRKVQNGDNLRLLKVNNSMESRVDDADGTIRYYSNHITGIPKEEAKRQLKSRIRRYFLVPSGQADGKNFIYAAYNVL